MTKYLMFLSFFIYGQALDAWTWTNSQGKKIEADFVKVEGGKVTIRLDKNGKEFSIPIKSLSSADQAYLKEQTKKKTVTKKKGQRAHEDQNIASAIKPNFNNPWPDRVEAKDNAPVKIVEESKEKQRFVYHSPHYEFICDVQLKTSVVRAFSKMFEATYQVMIELPMSFDRARNAKPGKRLKILLFETKEAYVKNGGPSRSGGVFIPKTNVVMIPLRSLGVKKSGPGYVLDRKVENQTIAHELVHQLQDFVYDKRGSLGWFTEGIAEYVSVSQYSANGNGSFTFKGNLNDIRKSVTEYDHKKQTGSDLGKEITVRSLKRYMLQSYGSFTMNGNFNYALGLMLTTYFIHMDDDGSRKNLTAFLKAMRQGVGGEKLLETLLAGRTWEELEKDIAAKWRKNGIKLHFQ